jgi:hypothetical protein
MTTHGKRNRPTRAYLLRCWQEDEPLTGAERRWRLSLEDVLRKGPRRGFDSLDALVEFLDEELASADRSVGQVHDESGRSH